MSVTDGLTILGLPHVRLSGIDRRAFDPDYPTATLLF